MNIKKLKDREPEAIEEYYREIILKQMAFIFKKGFQKVDCEDLSHEFFLALFDKPLNKIDKFKGYSCKHLKSWSWRVFLNYFKDWCKKKNKEIPVSLESLLFEIGEDPSNLKETQELEALQDQQNEELLNELHLALKKLNTPRRKRRYILIKSLLSGKSKSEIMVKLKITKDRDYDVLKYRAFEQLYWEHTLSQNTVCDYYAFLKRYEKGNHVPNALAKLKEHLEIEYNISINEILALIETGGLCVT